MSKVFEEKDKCCGCTACYSGCPVNAISMVSDGEGFLYPEINDDLCIKCNKCRTYCDFNQRPDEATNCFTQSIYGFKHKDELVLKNSTSGGAFTAVSDYILSIGGVVFGAVYDENMAVIHDAAYTAEERNLMRNAKYVQSNLNNTFQLIKDELDKGTSVLFSGTPCQVAGLVAFLSKPYDNLITVDIVCHSVTSPLMFSEYIRFVELKTHKKIIRHECRGKQDGWRTNENNTYSDGTEDRTSRFSQLHRRLFFKGVADRPSCYNCKYTSTRRVGDITLGDFWGIENEIPDFYDLNGVSLIMINSEKGMKIFERIKNNGETVLSCIEQVVPAQPHLLHPIKKPDNREQFWDIYYKKGYYKAIKFAFYRPMHECTVDFLKKIGIFSLLSKALGKE